MMRRREKLASPSPEDIAALYRLFLGREPESDDVVAKRAGLPWLQVVSDLFGSQEAMIRSHLESTTRNLRRAERFDVDVDLPKDVLAGQLAETRKYWEAVGADPSNVYWSVITDERWRDDVDDDGLRRFYGDGRQFFDEAVAAATAANPAFALERARVLDFGCGVGRALVHFAGRVAWTEGWDFSAPHLEVFRRNASRLFDLDSSDVHLRVLDGLDIAQPDPGFDMILSMITLQHNPPGVMAYLIRELLRSLRPDGIAVLHIPTCPLDAEERYTGELPRRPDMQMHAIPKRVIHEIAREEGVPVVNARYVEWCSPFALSEVVTFHKA